jgi:thiol-disulfide isomerase/thioredoxin
MRHLHCLTLGLLALVAVAVALPTRLAAGDAAKELLKVTDKLSNDDPADKVRTQSKCKIHTLKMEAGKGYKIDLRSDQFDSYLRLEDPTGAQVAEDDDSGGFPHARIVYQAPKSGDYRIIVTTYKGGATGTYNLTVVPVGKEEAAAGALEGRIKQINTLNPQQKAQVVEDLKKSLAGKGKDVGIRDAQLAMTLAMGLEGAEPKMAATACKDLGKLLSASTNAQVVRFAKMMDGAARRYNLPGNKIEVKGTLLDGKEFDWSKYKGKVVLVDFWATWCGPCVAEIPNIKKAYETYHDQGFEVVGISLDRNDKAPAQFMEQRKLPWACIFDKQGEGSMADYYGVFSIPRPILVDREGRVVSMNARGPELERQLQKLLGQGGAK